MAKQGLLHTTFFANERLALRMVAGFCRDKAYHVICCEAKISDSVADTDHSRKDVV